MFTHSKKGIVKPKAHIATYLSTSEPTSINEALSCDYWKTTTYIR